LNFAIHENNNRLTLEKSHKFNSSRIDFHLQIFPRVVFTAIYTILGEAIPRQFGVASRASIEK
jgi:hypothetical protein